MCTLPRKIVDIKMHLYEDVICVYARIINDKQRGCSLFQLMNKEIDPHANELIRKHGEITELTNVKMRRGLFFPA